MAPTKGVFASMALLWDQTGDLPSTRFLLDVSRLGKSGEKRTEVESVEVGPLEAIARQPFSVSRYDALSSIFSTPERSTILRGQCSVKRAPWPLVDSTSIDPP